MITIIGLVTIVTLIWLLAWAMGLESDSERRKLISASSAAAPTHSDIVPDEHIRRAA